MDQVTGQQTDQKTGHVIGRPTGLRLILLNNKPAKGAPR